MARCWKYHLSVPTWTISDSDNQQPKKPLLKPFKELITITPAEMQRMTDEEWDAYVKADTARGKARMKAERDKLKQSN